MFSTTNFTTTLTGEQYEVYITDGHVDTREELGSLVMKRVSDDATILSDVGSIDYINGVVSIPQLTIDTLSNFAKNLKKKIGEQQAAQLFQNFGISTFSGRSVGEGKRTLFSGKARFNKWFKTQFPNYKKVKATYNSNRKSGGTYKLDIANGKFNFVADRLRAKDALSLYREIMEFTISQLKAGNISKIETVQPVITSLDETNNTGKYTITAIIKPIIT